MPKFIGRLGHTVVSNVHVGGCDDDWDRTFERTILPYVRTAALIGPDKILVVVDRERRVQCCPTLARGALQILANGLSAVNLTATVAVVVSDRKFETVLMADYELVDTMSILAGPVSQDFGATLDGTDPKVIVDRGLKHGNKYRKVLHGAALASKMRLDDPTVLARSRALGKIVKELS